MPAAPDDARFMALALALGRRGLGRTWPNPAVGAVVVKDGVIVGRGSAYYLGSRADAFHAFVYAPYDDKVRRLVSSGKSREEASDLAETVDRDRAAFIERTFHVEWPARHRFHLMVNCGMGEELAVQTILDAAARFGERRT